VALGSLGQRLHVQGTTESHAEADPLFDEALSRLRTLCRDFPDRLDYRNALGNALLNRGMLDETMDRPPGDVAAVLTECLEIFDRLCEKGFLAAHHNRGVARHCLALQLREQGRQEEMLATCRRAYRDLEEARELIPERASGLDAVLDALRADFGQELGGVVRSP
jgi:hypothetical protein